MPSFVDTKKAITDSLALTTSLKRDIEGVYSLGFKSYEVSVTLSIFSKEGIVLNLSGPNTDINRIPSKVLKKYVDLRSQVEEWVEGNSLNFPDIGKRIR